MKTSGAPYSNNESHSPHMPEWTPSQLQESAKRRIDRMRNFDDESLGEVIANSVSNGIGAALSIAGLVILIVAAAMHGGGVRVLAALAFAVPMLLAFLMSTLYHAIPSNTPKFVFSILGHSFVLLYIAGACTPYCMLLLADAGGPVFCAVEWLLAFVGILVEVLWVSRPRWVQFAFGLVMACATLLLIPVLLPVLAPAGMGLLVAAWVCFLASFVFYLFRQVPYLWLVSHVLVIGGAVCLFLSVVLFVI